MLEQGHEEPPTGLAAHLVRTAANPDPCLDERPKQPGPYRSLMVGAVARAHVALIDRPIALGTRRHDLVDLWCGAEAFETFYALQPADVERQLGPAGQRRCRPPRSRPSLTVSTS